MIVDTGVDDKCPCCGEWTERAYRRFQEQRVRGRWSNAGWPADYCTCDGEAEDERDWPSHVYTPRSREALGLAA